MKDIRSMTPIVKKKKTEKRGQCVIRKNVAINTPFLPLVWPTASSEKEGRHCRIFFTNREEKTPNLLGLCKP
jgi:hypothetical protein